MRIALAQILAGTEPAANLALVEDYTRRAADAGATLVVFPEGTMSRFGVPLAPVAEPLDGPWADGVRRIAGAATRAWRFSQRIFRRWTSGTTTPAPSMPGRSWPAGSTRRVTWMARARAVPGRWPIWIPRTCIAVPCGTGACP